MNVRIMLTALTLAGFGTSVAWSPSAYAVGCVSGGVAGAAAGHMVNHGVLGAVGGCVAGHQYNKHKKQAAAQSGYQQNTTSSYNGAASNGAARTQ